MTRRFPPNRKEVSRLGARVGLFLLTLASIEGIAFVGCNWLQARALFFYEPASLSYDDFLRIRDPLTGWTSRHAGDMTWDRVGSRMIPAFPDPFETPPEVSLYGDSWTWSWPVNDELAYSNVLAVRLGTRVNNFGICGYGTDQAYLRFAANQSDTAPIVVLGVLSENILRNVTAFVDLINPSSGYGIKPRFLFTPDHRLEFMPAIFPSRQEFRSFLENPEDFLPEDYFSPNGRIGSGVARIEFPYSLSFTRILTGYRFRAAIRRRPRWSEFYDADHQSGSLQITAEIISQFVDLAMVRRKTPVIVMIPTGEDLEYFRSHNLWTYRPLLDEMGSRKIDLCHIGPGLLASLDGAPVADLYTDGNSHEHPNSLGYAVQAELVYQCLYDRRLISDK